MFMLSSVLHTACTCVRTRMNQNLAIARKFANPEINRGLSSSSFSFCEIVPRTLSLWQSIIYGTTFISPFSQLVMSPNHIFFRLLIANEFEEYMQTAHMSSFPDLSWKCSLIISSFLNRFEFPGTTDRSCIIVCGIVVLNYSGSGSIISSILRSRRWKIIKG